MNEQLKVFVMNDFDHYADYSKEEAIEHYGKQYDELSDKEKLEVRELTEKELNEMYIVFVDEEGQPKVTFKEHLNEMKQPEIFCSTEY